MKFELNPQCEPSVTHLGRELEPVLVIDNAVANLEALLTNACTRSFAPIGAYYPGVRAKLDQEFSDTLNASLQPWLLSVFGLYCDNWQNDVFYSIVTTPPERLAPIQRLPHYDGLVRERLAAIFFLNPADQGGTSFFRHRKTGFETVTEDRFEQFRETLENEVKIGGLPRSGYVTPESKYFETIATIAPKKNRMLIYRGVSLHCGDIDNTKPLLSDPSRGRLTINAFMLARGESAA